MKTTVQYIKVYTGSDHRLAGVRENSHQSFDTPEQAQDFAVNLAETRQPGNPGLWFVHAVQVIGG